MKNGKILLIVLFLGLFSLIYYEITHVYGTSANQIISLPKQDKNINAGIDKSDVRKTKFKKLIDIEGWAYINNIGADQQNVFIVLTSENNQYIYNTEKVFRGDLPSALNNQDNKIENAGFKGLIDTSDMVAGSYQIGFYIENGSRKEFSLSGISVVKNNSKIDFKENLSNKVDLILDKAKEKVQVNIEEVKKENGIFKVKGWGFLENGSPETSQTYIVLKRGESLFVFDTQLQIRKDVTANFGGKTDLDSSGFLAKIGEESIGKGKFQIGIYIKNGPLTGLHWSKESIGE